MSPATQPPPPGARPDWTIDQDWDAYTADEHRVWDTLYERQAALLPGRAGGLVAEFGAGHMTRAGG